MATQRTVKQRARALQAQAKERGENLPYTAALRMAEAHGITPKHPADRTLVQVLESLFTDDHQLFISASDDLERLKTEGLEEVFEDGEVEAFTVQQGNVYEAILTEWSVYDTPAQAMSVYGYTDENDLSNLTEHRLVDVWWELGHFKKLGDEYENKVTAVFAATEGAGEPTASYILSDLERFDMEELLTEVLGDALKVSNPNVFEDVLGDVSEMLSLEFMALLARPYIGKYEGWTQEAYGKVVAFWNENFDTPVHPLDTTEISTETAPSPAVTQGTPQHILKSYDQWHGKELFVYHSGELEMLRQGLDEVLEDEIDGTFTTSDNIFQWIIDTHDTIGTPLEELSIYAYPSDQVNELVEYPLVEQWWEVGQWAEIMQHYFSDSNQAVPSPDDMLQHQQRVEAITPALLTALTQGYGLETTDPVLGATVQEDSTFFPSLTALLCRRFIGQYEGWDQAAYEAAAHLWNGYYDKPLHPLDTIGTHDETATGTEPYPYGVASDPVIVCEADQYEIDLVNAGEQGRPNRVIVPKTSEQLHSIMRVNHLWNVQQRKAHSIRVQPEHHQRIVNVFLQVGDVIRFYGERTGKHHTKYIVRDVDPNGRYIFCNTASEKWYTIIDLHNGVRGAHDSYGHGGATEQAGEVIEAIRSERINLSARHTVLLDMVSVHRGEVEVF